MGKNRKGKSGKSKGKQEGGNNQPPQDPNRMEDKNQSDNQKSNIAEKSQHQRSDEEPVPLARGDPTQQSSTSSQSGVRVFPKKDASYYRTPKDEQRGSGGQQKYQETFERRKDFYNQPSGQEKYKPNAGYNRNQPGLSGENWDNKQKQASYTQNPRRSPWDNRQQQQSAQGQYPEKVETYYNQNQPQSSRPPWGSKQQQQKPSGESAECKNLQKADTNYNQNQPRPSGQPSGESAWVRRPQIEGVNKPHDENSSTVKPSLINVVGNDGDQKIESKGGAGSKSSDAYKKSDGDKIICVPENKFTPGTLGSKIRLITNHFELSLGKVQTVILYDVAFEPNRPKRLVKEAYSELRKAHFVNCNPAFDGGKFVYSIKELPFGHSISDTVTITTNVIRPMEFKVTMTYIKEINLEPLKRYIMNNGKIELTMASIQALDIILGHTMWMKNIKVGASYFTRPERDIVDLGGGMELYRGCFQSVNLGNKLYLNVDVANKAFPKKQNVINLIGELGRNVNFQQPLDDRSCQALDKYIKNLKIEFCLPNKPSSKRHYTVNGVHYSASSTKFNYESEPGQSQTVSVEEYFRLVHSTDLEYPQMPCLWVGRKDRTIYLPSELCKILENQVVTNKLDVYQTTKMIRACATDATTRKNSIRSCLSRAGYNNDPVVNEFDLSVSEEFKKLEGRVLEAPKLQYRNGGIQATNGVWRAKEFLVPARIESWTIISLDYKVNNRHMEDLARGLINGSRLVGMEMGQPVKPFKEVKINMLMQILDKYKNLGIVFVVISDGVYKQVKQQAEQAVGCLTQCLTGFTVLKKLNPATIANILLKVNAKCGGINHVLSTPPPIMNEPIMIMGADVTHPSPHSAEPSVAAVTASHDLAASKYNLSCRIQRPTLEIIYDLENMTREHILYFKKETGKLPVRIIFYRDGVSMGQFETVLASEFQAIRRACNKVQENYNPSITLIVVQKRHHTRLFPENPKDTEDKNGNVPAGTCVDTDIVLPNYQNFYLVSHASIQGVARPTKYVTLSDDHGFSNDALQSLTYYLCHMYTRCTRSVSYPAPTYYAHLAALRGKTYIDLLRFDINNLEREQRKFQVKEEIIKGLPMFFV